MVGRFEPRGMVLKAIPRSPLRGLPAHPGDAARMKAMLFMLELTDCETDVPEIQEKWHRFINVISNDKPSFFEDIYEEDKKMIELLFANKKNGE